MTINIPIDIQVGSGFKKLKDDIASIKSDLAQPFNLEVTPKIDAQQFRQQIQKELNQITAIPIQVNLEIGQAQSAINNLNQQMQALRAQFQQPIQIAPPQIQPVAPGQPAGQAAAAGGFAVPQATTQAPNPNNQSARSIGAQIARVAAINGVPVADVLHALVQAGLPVSVAPITAEQGVNIALDSISQQDRQARQAQQDQKTLVERQANSVNRVRGRFGVGDFLRQITLGDEAAIRGFTGRLETEEREQGFAQGSLLPLLREQGLSPAIDFRRWANTDVLRSAALNLTFGGPGAAVASLAGGLTPLGAQGANLAGLAFQSISGIITPVVAAVQELGKTFSESGQLFQQAVLTVGSILQSSQQFITSTGIPLSPAQQLAFQEEEATRIQQLTVQKLRKFGIGGAQESTLLGSVVSGLGQRGFIGSPEQIATITERLGATIQVLRPTLFERPANLQREVQDFLAGGALAQRTALAPLVRPTISDITRATSIEDIEKATEKLQSFVDTALTTTNPAAVQFRFKGAQETVTQEGGKAFIDAIAPGLIEATKTLQSDKLKQSFKELGQSIGELAGRAVAASAEISKAAAGIGAGIAGAVKNLLTPQGLLGAGVGTALLGPLLFRVATAAPGALRALFQIPGNINSATARAAAGALGAASVGPEFIGPVAPALAPGLRGAFLRSIAQRGVLGILGGALTGPLGIGVNAAQFVLSAAPEMIANSQNERVAFLSDQAEKVKQRNLKRQPTDQLNIDTFLERFGLKEKFSEYSRARRTTPSIQLAEFEDLKDRAGTTPAFKAARDLFNIDVNPSLLQRQFQDIQSGLFIGGPTAKAAQANIRRTQVSPNILSGLVESRSSALQKAADALTPSAAERSKRQTDIDLADIQVANAQRAEFLGRRTLRTAQQASGQLKDLGLGFLDDIVNAGLIERLTREQIGQINRRRDAQLKREGLPDADSPDIKGLREALQDVAEAELRISQEKKTQLELAEQETEAARERVSLIQQQFVTSTAGGKADQAAASIGALDVVLERLGTSRKLLESRLGEVGDEISTRQASNTFLQTLINKAFEEAVKKARGKSDAVVDGIADKLAKDTRDARLALAEGKSALFRSTSEQQTLEATLADQPLRENAVRVQQSQLAIFERRRREEEINELANRVGGQTFQERDARFALQREAIQEGINSRLQDIAKLGPNAEGNDATQQRQFVLEALGLVSGQRQNDVAQGLEQFNRKAEETRIRELQIQQREAIIEETRKRKELTTQLDASKTALERFAATAQTKALGKESELLGIVDQLKAIGADVPFDLDLSPEERKRFQEASLRSRGNELAAELGQPTLFGLSSQSGLRIAQTTGDSPFAKQLDLEQTNLKAAVERTTIELEKLPIALENLNEALAKAEFLRGAKETPLREKLPVDLDRAGQRLGTPEQEKALREAQGLLPRGVSEFLKKSGVKIGEATSIFNDSPFFLFDSAQKTLFTDINKIGTDQGRFGFAQGAGQALLSNLDKEARSALEASFDKDAGASGTFSIPPRSFSSVFNDVFAEQVSGSGADAVSQEFPKLAAEIRKLIGQLDSKSEASKAEDQQQKLTQSITALISAINSAKAAGLKVDINETSLAQAIASAINHNIVGGGPSPPSGVP